MTDASDSVGLVENAEPPGRSSFRAEHGPDQQNLSEDVVKSQDIELGLDNQAGPQLNQEQKNGDVKQIHENQHVLNGQQNGHKSQDGQQSQVIVNQPSQQHPDVSGTTPVYYATKYGATVAQEQVVIGSNGQSTIRTPQTPTDPDETPIKAKDIRFLFIFSVVGTLCLFPVGIAALYFSFQTRKEFVKGLQTADLSKAKKLAKRTEHLIIFSFIGGMVVLAIVFAVIERYIWAHDSDYWDHKVHPVRGVLK